VITDTDADMTPVDSTRPIRARERGSYRGDRPRGSYEANRGLAEAAAEEARAHNAKLAREDRKRLREERREDAR
jgi:hypothetical protein